MTQPHGIRVTSAHIKILQNINTNFVTYVTIAPSSSQDTSLDTNSHPKVQTISKYKYIYIYISICTYLDGTYHRVFPFSLCNHHAPLFASFVRYQNVAQNNLVADSFHAPSTSTHSLSNAPTSPIRNTTLAELSVVVAEFTEANAHKQHTQTNFTEQAHQSVSRRSRIPSLTSPARLARLLLRETVTYWLILRQHPSVVAENNSPTKSLVAHSPSRIVLSSNVYRRENDRISRATGSDHCHCHCCSCCSRNSSRGERFRCSELCIAGH